MPPRDRHAAQFLPLTSLDFQVLTLLAHRELHGYAIIQAASEAFPGQPVLEVGSLYRIISRMLDQRLLREVPAPRDSKDDQRVRRFYATTDLGIAVAKAEAARLRSLLASPATVKLLRAPA